MNTKTQTLTSDQIINNLLNSKGQFVRVVWKSDVKPAAIHKDKVLEKRTSAVVRSGVNFANLSAVKEGIANDERGEVQELPWGQWLSFPYVIEHKDTLYLRMYPSDTKSTTVYYVNGETVDKSDFIALLTPSESKKITEGVAPPCFNVKRDNIISTEDFNEE